MCPSLRETNIYKLDFKMDKLIRCDLMKVPQPYDQDFSNGFKMVQIGLKVYVTLRQTDTITQLIEMDFDRRR